MITTIDIISGDEVDLVHGHANFGGIITKRHVINEGVLKYACGYTTGSTQLNILLEHGLVKAPRPGSYVTTLTAKGIRYLGAMIREVGFSEVAFLFGRPKVSTMNASNSVFHQIAQAIISRNEDRAAAGEGQIEEMWPTRGQHAALSNEQPALLTKDDGHMMGARLRVIGT